jgi:hypothetical protein
MPAGGFAEAGGLLGVTAGVLGARGGLLGVSAGAFGERGSVLGVTGGLLGVTAGVLGARGGLLGVSAGAFGERGSVLGVTGGLLGVTAGVLGARGGLLGVSAGAFGVRGGVLGVRACPETPLAPASTQIHTAKAVIARMASIPPNTRCRRRDVAMNGRRRQDAVILFVRPIGGGRLFYLCCLPSKSGQSDRLTVRRE